MALDRAGGNEMLLRDYTKYSNPSFDSIYDHLIILFDQKTEGAELLS